MAQEGKQKAENKGRHWLPQETRDHLHKARKEFGKSFSALFPTAFIEHRRAARREFLLAVRSLIDRTLDYLEEAEKA